jgi:hypothetical protein
MKLLDNMHEIKTLLENIETLAESPIGPGLEFFMSYLLIRTLQQNDFNRRDSKSKVTQKTVVNAILFSEAYVHAFRHPWIQINISHLCLRPC